jgi:uncharacterized protein DUF6962
VTVSEPTTLVTDCLLGTLAEVSGVVLLNRNRALAQSCITLWALGLIAAGLGSYAGGTYHGFHQAVTSHVASGLWKVTTLSMGAASFLLLAAGLNSAFQGRARQWLIAATAVKLVVYADWMLRHDDFKYVIYDYGSTLVILFVLVVMRYTSGLSSHRAYIASGILVSMAAAAVQQTGIRLHEHFNHNDLMHIVQMGGVWLLFKGGLLLRDHEDTKA